MLCFVWFKEIDLIHADLDAHRFAQRVNKFCRHTSWKTTNEKKKAAMVTFQGARAGGQKVRKKARYAGDERDRK